MAYSPLGRGFLTGRFQRPEDLPEGDFRRRNPRFQGENFQKNLKLVERVREIASEKRCTASQLALAWVAAQGDDIVPIPGTKRRNYLEENVRALDVRLTKQDTDRINEVMPRGLDCRHKVSSQRCICWEGRDVNCPIVHGLLTIAWTLTRPAVFYTSCSAVLPPCLRASSSRRNGSQYARSTLFPGALPVEALLQSPAHRCCVQLRGKAGRESTLLPARRASLRG